MAGMHDIEVYRADEIAEDAHGMRQPKGSIRLGKGQWMVLWGEQSLYPASLLLTEWVFWGWGWLT